jgi:membrane protein implicated in regulation of membrane protease activity
LSWWLWLTLGLGLLIVELVTPGGPFILFFGLGALVVGVVVGLGGSEAAWFQWILFSVFSVLALVFLRRPLRARLNLDAPEGRVDSLVGGEALLLEDLPLGGVAKAELRGSSWNARNAGQAPLSKGQRCRVERVEGLTLWVLPE